MFDFDEIFWVLSHLVRDRVVSSLAWREARTSGFVEIVTDDHFATPNVAMVEHEIELALK